MIIIFVTNENDQREEEIWHEWTKSSTICVHYTIYARLNLPPFWFSAFLNEWMNEWMKDGLGSGLFHVDGIHLYAAIGLKCGPYINNSL